MLDENAPEEDGEIVGLYREQDIARAERVFSSFRHADGLEQKAALKSAEHQALSAQAPFTRNNPPTFLNGMPGNQQQVLPGQEIQVANWVGEDAEATAVDCLFGPVDQFPPLTPGGVQYRPYGVVLFGTKGMSLRAEVDIGRGVQFTVPAASVQLLVALEAQTPLLPGTQPLKMTGMLAFNVVTHQQPVTRTIFGELDASTSSDLIPIPAFARSLTLQRNNSLADVHISVINYTGTGITSFDRAASASETTMDPIPLAGEAAYIQLTETAGVGTFYRLIFNLAF